MRPEVPAVPENVISVREQNPVLHLGEGFLNNFVPAARLENDVVIRLADNIPRTEIEALIPVDRHFSQAWPYDGNQSVFSSLLDARNVVIIESDDYLNLILVVYGILNTF
jgi:hypothetical protein